MRTLFLRLIFRHNTKLTCLCSFPSGHHDHVDLHPDPEPFADVSSAPHSLVIFCFRREGESARSFFLSALAPPNPVNINADPAFLSPTVPEALAPLPPSPPRPLARPPRVLRRPPAARRPRPLLHPPPRLAPPPRVSLRRQMRSSSLAQPSSARSRSKRLQVATARVEILTWNEPHTPTRIHPKIIPCIILPSIHLFTSHFRLSSGVYVVSFIVSIRDIFFNRTARPRASRALPHLISPPAHLLVL